MKNIPPPPPRRRRRKSRPVQSRRRLNRRHRNGCTVTTTLKSHRFHHPFFVWASPLLKDLHPKRDLFRLQNFIRKSSSSLPSKNSSSQTRNRIVFNHKRENKDHANVATVNSKCFPYARNLFQRFLRSEIAERTLA